MSFFYSLFASGLLFENAGLLNQLITQNSTLKIQNLKSIGG